MSVTFAAHTVRRARGQEISVQALADGDFRVRIEFDGDWVFLDLNREQLEQFNTYIHQALLEALPY